MIADTSTTTFWNLGRRPPAAGVRLFDHDPDLLAGLDDQTAELLRRRVVVPQVQLACGPWSPPAAGDRLAGAIGLLVLDGLVCRCIRLQGRDCAELLGAGDLLRPWDGSADGPFERPTTWRVLQPTLVAVLDDHFAALLGRWPSIVSALIARSALRSRGLAMNLAIAHIRHAELRLLTLLWLLADRWGRVTPQGVALPLPLTHELLGQLVCLHRPTTSSALQRLVRTGEIARRSDRGWTLLGEPPAQATVDAGPSMLAAGSSLPCRACRSWSRC
jgi:CRP/FNR family cyclic AMP-dependent transcriptional regulator